MKSQLRNLFGNFIMQIIYICVGLAFLVWCSCWTWIQFWLALVRTNKEERKEDVEKKIRKRQVKGQNMDFEDNCVTCDDNSGDGYCLRCGHYHCHSCLKLKIIRTMTERLECGVKECTGFMDSNDIANVVQGGILENYLELVFKLKRNSASTATSNPNLRSGNFSTSSSSSSTSSTASSSDSDQSESDADDEFSGFGQLSSSIKFLVAAGYSEEEAVQYYTNQSVLLTTKSIKCNICLEEEILPGDGIIIKNCLHIVCRDCLVNYINASESPEIECPCTDGSDKCHEVLLPLEVRELCSEETYRKHYIDLSLKVVEQSGNMAHCYTPNCPYFCDRGDQYIYTCPDCQQDNCYRCKVQHTGLRCWEYEEKLEREKAAQEAADWERRNKLLQRQNDLLSQAAIDRKVETGVFRPCPRCNVIIEKNAGCDHMICSRCKFDYQWSQVTARPNGTIPTSRVA